jgi:hypothetical protein
VTQQFVQSDLQFKRLGVVANQELLVCFRNEENIWVFVGSRNDVAQRHILEAFVLPDFTV